MASISAMASSFALAKRYPPAKNLMAKDKNNRKPFKLRMKSQIKLEALEIDPGLSLNYIVLAMIRIEAGQQQEARGNPNMSEYYVLKGDDPQVWLVQGSMPTENTIGD